LLIKTQKIMNTNLTKQLNLLTRRIFYGIAIQFCLASALMAGDLSSKLADTTVSGKITDENGVGLPGASIIEKSTSNGAITDADGNYKLTVSESATLIISFIGYQTATVDLNGRSVIDLQLGVDAKQLSEVVVTAFGLEREKKGLGYSVTQISGKEFTQSRAINMGSALSGKVAGVNVTTPATGAAGSSRVVIRGGSSLTGNDQPLYVVNGVPMDNTTTGSAGLWGGNDGGDGLSSLNPDDIESMSVLKGNAAAALYGARASNGVVLITTKSGKSQNGIGVSFNSNLTFDKVIDQTDFQKEYGYGNNGTKPINQASALDNGNNSWGAKLDGADVVQFDGVSRPYADQGESVKDFFRTGHTWTNTIGLSGGNESHTYRFSASKLKNEDITPNTGFDKETFSANISGKYGKLTSRVTGQYSKETAKNRPRLSDTPGNANFSVLMLNPAVSYASLLGDPNKLGANADGTELRHQGNVFSTNPYWAAHQFSREDVRDRLLGSALLRYDLTDWLYVQARAGTDFFSRTDEDLTPYGTAYSGLGGMNITTRKVRENNMDGFIGINKTFGEFEVDALIGGNKMRRSDESTRVGGDDFNFPFFHFSMNEIINHVGK
jgi:TonB-linked SusC/RagA family outer membrane protein